MKLKEKAGTFLNQPKEKIAVLEHSTKSVVSEVQKEGESTLLTIRIKTMDSFTKGTYHIR